MWRIEGTFPWEKSIFNKDRKKSYWIFWKLYVLIPFCCHKIAPQRIQDRTFVPVFSLTMFPLGKRFTITYCRLLENIKMKENIHAICVHARSKTNFVLWLYFHFYLFIYLLANSVNTKCRPSKLIAILSCKIIIDALASKVHIAL